jgi:SAM-dependent methyltransferase
MLLNKLEESLLTVDLDTDSMVTGFHGWISLSLNEFFAGMEIAQQYLIDRNKCWTTKEKFLDVGSGIGEKLALAHAMGWDVAGIELRQEYIDQSIKLWPDFPVERANAFVWDNYDQFDLVYFYRPCVEEDLQGHLTNYIISKMKPGALLFGADIPEPQGLIHIAEQVWEIPNGD